MAPFSDAICWSRPISCSSTARSWCWCFACASSSSLKIRSRIPPISGLGWPPVEPTVAADGVDGALMTGDGAGLRRVSVVR